MNMNHKDTKGTKKNCFIRISSNEFLVSFVPLWLHSPPRPLRLCERLLGST